VSWCRPSRRAFATAVWSVAMRAWVRRHRCEGCCRVRLSGPVRREACRCRRRSSRSATSRCRGFADDLPGGEHRQALHPEVDTDHRLRPGRGRVVAFDLHGERAEPPPACVTVAERIRALPRSTCRASFRVDSCVRTRPMSFARKPGEPDRRAPGGCQSSTRASYPARSPGSPSRWSTPPSSRPTTARRWSSPGSTITADCRPTTTPTG
jgi:hypothetical protein